MRSMQEKSVTITPNKRLARHLQKQFCCEAICKNRSTWQTASFIPLETWLSAIWLEQDFDSRILLTTNQELLVWQKIIYESIGEKFTYLSSIFAKTHRLVHAWNLEDKIEHTYHNANTHIFQKISKKFAAYCLTKNLITIALISNALTPHSSDLNLKNISLVGFDEYTPQFQNFLSSLERSGCLITKLDPNNINESRQNLIGLDNQVQEITIMARWAKNLIKNSTNKNIGIIVPNLVSLRSKISRIFDEIIGKNQLINISAGTPLLEYPIIECALNLLEFNQDSDLKSISKILLSPYIVGASLEKPKRITFNLALSELVNPEFKLGDIKYLKKYHDDIPIFIHALEKHQKFIKTTKIQKEKHYPAEWIKVFRQMLKNFGWPDNPGMTSHEIAAIERFTELLQEMAATSFITERIPFNKACQILKDIVSQSDVQPEHNFDAPINIMGILEAAGITFDHMWVMGLDQESWPKPPEPNPFIPVLLQKKHQLPHASYERELHFFQNLLARYKRSSKDIIFSYTKFFQDKPTVISPLLSDIPSISLDGLQLETSATTQEDIYDTKKLETLCDNQAINLPPNEIQTASSRLLELQSLCPFKAFMEFRLATPSLLKTEHKINKANRGILIHKILELFWNQLKSQENLLKLTNTQIQSILDELVETSLNKLGLLGQPRKIEKQCLVRLLMLWIEVEKKRPAFWVVATEKTISVKLAEITFRLRIDRIDKLEDGTSILIDYKTGKIIPTIFDWFGPNPENPQIPLYCLTPESIDRIALAHVNIEHLKFKDISLKELIYGLHNSNMDEPNKEKGNTTWDEIITHWHTNLSNLAAAFAAGSSTPNPISPQICQRCDFGQICRAKQY